MQTIVRCFAYFILALPVTLVRQASEGMWGSVWLAFVGFVLLYAVDFWISVFVHEIGHALAAKFAGWKVLKIAAFPIAYNLRSRRISFWAGRSGDSGGVVEMAPNPGTSRTRQGLVYAAGPLANAALGMLAVFCAMALPNSMSDIVGSLAVMSLLLGIGNILPWTSKSGLKSDGRVLLSIIRRSPNKRRRLV